MPDQEVHEEELETTEPDDDEVVETEEEVEEVVEDDGDKPVTRRDLDKMVAALTKSTQSQLDKGLERVRKAIRPGPKNATEEVITGYCDANGLDVVEVLEYTKECKTLEEALGKIVEGARELKTKGRVKAKPVEEEPKEKAEKEQPKKNKVVSVPPVTKSRGGLKPTREALRDQFNSGELDNQQYLAKLEKFGYSM